MALAQPLKFLLRVVFDSLAAGFRAGRFCLQMFQGELGIARQFLLAVRQIGIAQAVVGIGRIGIGADVELQQSTSPLVSPDWRCS